VPLRPDRRHRWVAAGLALALLATACSGSDDSSDRPVVEVFGNLVGSQGRLLGQVLTEVAEDAGVELRYVGVTSFIEQLYDRFEQGDRPDVVLLPQPGVLAELDRRGVLQPLPAEAAAAVRQGTPAALANLAAIDGEVAAAWLTIDVKGLVWYQPSEFADRGLSVPRTLDELGALSEDIRTTGDGVAPWCVTAEAGASTGWVGTDWVEAYVLRRLGPAAYDRWTAGDLPFDDPAIVGVFEELDALLRAPGAMAGGSRAVLTTPWELAANGLLSQPPRCLMVQQADLLLDHFPAGTSVGPDGDLDYFVVPAAGAGSRAPALVGGLLAAPLAAGPAVEEAMSLLAGVEMAEALNRTGELLSPNLLADPDSRVDDVSAGLLQVVQDASVARFDGSDLMPPAVGTGTFWSGMVSFLGREDIASVVAAIQAGWPEPDDATG
jgi:alpha-glucoside transport system substrate-binding protein